MNDPELIEYAVYHWTFGGDQNLPGLNHDGTIDSEFFDRYPINASYGDFAEQFTQLKNDPILSDENSLLLCSGGVDSSLLACFRKRILDILNNNFFTPPTSSTTTMIYINSIMCSSTARVLPLSRQLMRMLTCQGLISCHRIIFFQNTYGPTLAFALDSANAQNFHHWSPAQALTNCSMVWKSIRGMCSRN